MLPLFVVLPCRVIAGVPTIPRGVFALIKSGAPTGSSVLSNPDVDGISLREGWDAVNPSEDVYDWSYFDAEITKAKNAGKTVLIRVSDGGKSLPDWVRAASAAAGEPTFSFYETSAQGGAVITEPVFWAPTLLAKKAKLVAAFGARYDSNSTVAIVTCQFAGARNDDWNMPHGTTVDGIAPTDSSETSRWLAAGYTTVKMIDAGNQIINNTMAAFPSKPVGLAIGRTSDALDPQGVDYVAETVINTARAKWGNRMVATHNNMSEKATPLPLPGSFWSLIYDLRPAVGGQMLWFSYGDSTCRNAENGVPCDAATVLTNSVERAYEYGWNYLEIYNADIVGLPSVIHYAHGLLAQSSVTRASAVFTYYALSNPSTRQTALWYLRGPSFAQGVTGPTLPAGWALANTADFNSDGHPDYLLFNSGTRQTGIWYLNNGAFVASAFGPTLPAGWVPVTAVDFNGDSKPDYVLFNPNTRQTAIWYLNGTTYVSGSYGPTLPSDWTLTGATDFNGDGSPDYVLFNPNTRQTAIWYLNGGSFTGSVLGPTPPAGWILNGPVDFNGDGKPDYVLSNPSTRQTAIWFLNGATFASSAFGPTLPVNFSISSP